MIYTYTYTTPLGNVVISENGDGICEIKLENHAKQTHNTNIKQTPLIKTAYTQLCEYLKGERKTFDLKLSLCGTQFQNAVWNELCNIPYGSTISYKELAIRIGSPKACRAVGLANNKNPIWVVIPCHRVVGSDGKLTGYAGGLHIKEALLNLESGAVNNKNIDIEKELRELADEDYKKFASSLLPETNNMIGVRLPQLRKIAKKYAKSNPCGLISSLGDSFEETMLHGMLIGYLIPSQYNVFKMCDEFLPKINNWSVCDSFCSGLKFAKSHKGEMWRYILPLFTSEKQYYVRFALVMATFYYMDKEYLPQVLAQIKSVRHDGYYAKMAAAWALSICFVNDNHLTFDFMENEQLDEFIFNKAIQKICESKQVSIEDKEKVRSLKAINL